MSKLEIVGVIAAFVLFIVWWVIDERQYFGDDQKEDENDGKD